MKESLLWILSEGNKHIWKDMNEEIKDKKELLKSLGLKGDSVGWCNLDLNNENTDYILDELLNYKAYKNCDLRGYYDRKNDINDNDEWYELRTKYTSIDFYEPEEDRKNFKIFAYKIPRNLNYLYCSSATANYIVSDELKKICEEEKFSGIQFKWANDVGKYRAKQFYEVILPIKVPQFYTCNHLKHSREQDRVTLKALGGKLPRILDLFDELDVRTPVIFSNQDMPDSDFTYYNYYSRSHIDTGLLIRKSAADILLAKHIISQKDLMPVRTYDTVSPFYKRIESQEFRMPTVENMKKAEEDYQKIMKMPRPEYKINEKMALKKIRNQKKENPEYFQKALPKDSCDNLINTLYEILIPYYKISNGACLTDEYTFLSYENSLKETEEFNRKIKNEETIQPIKGIVIAHCIDGDRVILLEKDKSLIRLSHEIPEVVEMWCDLHTFMYTIF